MKTFKTIFNVFVYANLLFAMAVLGYQQLPTEYQFLNELGLDFVVLTGGTTSLIGIAGLYVKSVITQNTLANEQTTGLVAEKFLSLKDEYVSIKANEKVIITNQEEIKTLLKRNNELKEVELNARLSNPLVDEKVKALIEGVLNEE